MKCKICGKEIPDQQRFCEFCGQPVGAESASAAICAAAESHWKEAAEQNQQYEAKRTAVSARVRKKCRRIRIRWVLMALIVIGLVWFLGFTDEGVNLTENAIGYANAWWDMEEDRYHDAYDRLVKLDSGFPGVQEGIGRCEERFRAEFYEAADNLYRRGDYRGALAMFRSLEGYRDCEDRVRQCLDEIWQAMDAPVLNWTFDEGMDSLEGIGWWNDGVEWKRVVDSQITHALYINDRDKMTTSTKITVSDLWTVSLLMTNLDRENRNILAVNGTESGFDGQLCIRDNRLVWIQTLAEQTVELYGGQLEEPGSRWYDVAVCRDGDTMLLYVDGILMDTAQCAGLPAEEHQVTLHLGNWNHHVAGTVDNGSFLGYIGELTMYDYPMREEEAMLRYQPYAYDATHLWDTSFYFLPEDNPEQTHFVFLQLQEYGDHMCLVMLHQNPTRDILTLNWDKDYGILEILNAESVLGYDLYYLDGENWYYDGYYEEFHAVYNVIGVTSSDMMLYTNYGEEVLPVMVGGRG